MAFRWLSTSISSTEPKVGVLSVLDYFLTRPGLPTLTMTIKREKSGAYSADIVITESSGDIVIQASSEEQQPT